MQTPARVLLVDDDPAILELTATRLEREADPFDVVSATSAAEAIDVLEADSRSIECVVSDYDMPGGDGLALLETVRRIDDDLPFILFTGKGTEEIAGEAISSGVTDYIQKAGLEQYTVLANRIANAVSQYRATQSAAATEHRLRKLAEQSNDVLWMFSADWDELLFVNSAVESVFGVEADRLRADPRSFMDAIHPADRDRVRTVMDQLSAGESVSVEYRVNESADYGHWVWVNAEPIFDAAGSVERIVGFSRDITERKRRERALAALNDVAVDLDTLESVEAVCERAIAASEQLLNFDLSIIDIESDGYLSKAAISEEIPQEEVTTMSIEEGIAGRTYRTGESMLIDDVSAHPEAEPQGPFRSAISIPIASHGVFQAVDEDPNAFSETDLELGELLGSHTASALDRLEREGRLRRQNERLDEFSRFITHDLRNPLNVLSGSIALAGEECASPHLETAAAALERMNAIIDDTRLLATDGAMIEELTCVDLETVATDCWRTVPTESATLEVSAADRVRADRDRLHHVLENLFRNAVEHGSTGRSEAADSDDAAGSEGSELTVRVGDCEDGFFVEDDGVGISDDEVDSVLEMGYSSTGGTGYGLTIVHRIADAHGWDVRVTDSVTGGARFEFSGVDTR